MGDQVTKAVILAAGMGNRLGDIAKGIPKGFLVLGERTIIEESIQKLFSFGIKDIIIVTGYCCDSYEYLKDRYDCIKTIKNEIYAQSGSMYSLYCARNLIDENFLLIESDLIYEMRALDEILKASNDNCLLISGETKSGDEVYVELLNGKVQRLSKNKSELNSVAGESVGISKISMALFTNMLKECKDLFKRIPNAEYDIGCISNITNKADIYSKTIEDLLWAEIDDKNHFLRARDDIYPKIQDNDLRYYGRHSKND